MTIERREHKSRGTDEGFFKSHWREFMAWSYGIVCLWDFMLAPVFFSWYAHYVGTPYVAWVPLTTSGGGLYHVAMGAIIGVSSYGNTQEKVTNITTSSQFQAPSTLPTLPSNSQPATTPDSTN